MKRRVKRIPSDTPVSPSTAEPSWYSLDTLQPLRDGPQSGLSFLLQAGDRSEERLGTCQVDVVVVQELGKREHLLEHRSLLNKSSNSSFSSSSSSTPHPSLTPCSSLRPLRCTFSAVANVGKLYCLVLSVSWRDVLIATFGANGVLANRYD